MQSLDSEPRRRLPKISILDLAMLGTIAVLLLVGFVTLLSNQCFFQTPELGDSTLEVREKLGVPVSADRDRGWLENQAQAGWYSFRTDESLQPEQLPPIKDSRWSYMVGPLDMFYFMIDFEDGKVCEIFLGGT